MHTVRIHVPAPVAPPRGARWAAALALATIALLRAMAGLVPRSLNALEELGREPRLRTTGDVLQLARQVQNHSPSLAAELRAIAAHWPEQAEPAR